MQNNIQDSDHPQEKTQEKNRERSSTNQSEVAKLSQEDFKEYSQTTIQIPYDQSPHNIKIQVVDPTQKGTGIQRYTIYTVKLHDKYGDLEIYRRYSQFDTLRHILVDRWPGILVPPIPSKQVLNKTDNQLIQNRLRFLNDFMKKIADIDYLYYSEEFQLFLRSQNIEISKELEKFKKQSYKQLLHKYQITFHQFSNQKNIEQQRKTIQGFESFIKQNKGKIQQYKKQARALAEARDKYNNRMSNVFQKILPEYEANSLFEFSNLNQKALIFKKNSQIKQLDSQELKQKISKSNPLWLLYDLLKFEQRQMEAMIEAIKGLSSITHKLSDIKKQIKNNNEEIQSINQGKTTIKSFLTKGTNEEIVEKLKGENEQLDKEVQVLQILQKLIVGNLAKTISIFKIVRQRFYNKVLKYTFSYEMHTCKVTIDYFGALNETSKKFID